MRIALISYEFPPDTGKGGIGTYTYQLAILLAHHNIDVHVFAGTAKESYHQELQKVFIHKVNCKDPFDFREKVVSVFSKVHYIKAFDIIESPEIHSNAFEIKKKFPLLPLIVRLHAPNYLVECFKKKYTPFFQKIRFVIGALRRGKLDYGYWRKYDYVNDNDYKFAQIADIITAPSNIMKLWAVKNWHILPAHIEVIPNPFIPSNALLELSIKEKVDNKEIIFFGRLNVLKGLVNGTLAMKKILIEFPEYHFTIIGDDGAGPKLGESMKQWMQKKLKKVNNQVSFFAGQEYGHLPLLISNASIVLLPSLFESFSYTCAEAMASGKVVVGSLGTGMENMIVHNYNGFLINAESHKNIYEAVKTLIENNSLRYSLSVNARKSIHTFFNSEVLAQQYIQHYKKIAAVNG